MVYKKKILVITDIIENNISLRVICGKLDWKMGHPTIEANTLVVQGADGSNNKDFIPLIFVPVIEWIVKVNAHFAFPLWTFLALLQDSNFSFT